MSLPIEKISRSIPTRVSSVPTTGMQVLGNPDGPCVEHISFSPNTRGAELIQRMTRVVSGLMSFGFFEQTSGVALKTGFWEQIGYEAGMGSKLKAISYGKPWLPTAIFEDAITNVIAKGKDPATGQPWFSPLLTQNKDFVSLSSAYCRALADGQLSEDGMWVKALISEATLLPVMVPSPVAMAPEVEADIIRWSGMGTYQGDVQTSLSPLPQIESMVGSFTSYAHLMERIAKYGRQIKGSYTVGHTGIRGFRIILGFILGSVKAGSWPDVEKYEHAMVKRVLQFANLPLWLSDSSTTVDPRGFQCSPTEFEAFLRPIAGYFDETDSGTITSRRRLATTDAAMLSEEMLDTYAVTRVIGDLPILVGGCMIPKIGGHPNPVFVAQPNKDGSRMWLNRRPNAEAVATSFASAIEDVYNAQSLSRAAQAIRNMGEEPGISILTATDDGRLAFVAKLMKCTAYKMMPFDVNDTNSQVLTRYEYDPRSIYDENLRQAVASSPNENKTFSLDMAWILSSKTGIVNLDGGVYASAPTWGLAPPIPTQTNENTQFSADSVVLTPIYIHGSPSQLPGASPIAVQYREYSEVTLSQFTVRTLTIDMARLLSLSNQDANIGIIPSHGHGFNVATGMYIAIQSGRFVLGKSRRANIQSYLEYYVAQNLIQNGTFKSILESLATQANVPIRSIKDPWQFATLHSLQFATLGLMMSLFTATNPHTALVFGQQFSMDSSSYMRSILSAMTTGSLREQVATKVERVTRESLRPLNSFQVTPAFPMSPGSKIK